MRLSFKVIYLKQETLKNEKDSLKKNLKDAQQKILELEKQNVRIVL